MAKILSRDDNTYSCEPLDGTATVNMLLAETMATFLYASVILSVKYFHRGPDVLKAFAIGGCLLGMYLMIEDVSGASINPTIGLVQTIFQYLALKDTDIRAYET